MCLHFRKKIGKIEKVCSTFSHEFNCPCRSFLNRGFEKKSHIFILIWPLTYLFQDSRAKSNFNFEFGLLMSWYLLHTISNYSIKKARFARVRAARGWIILYHGSCIDPFHLFHTLNPTWEVPFLRLCVPIRLLIKDLCTSSKLMIHSSDNKISWC